MTKKILSDPLKGNQAIMDMIMEGTILYIFIIKYIGRLFHQLLI